MATVLITGANRGIGLEMARQYAGDDWRVLAACRDPAGATQLAELSAGGADLRLLPLDVRTAESCLRLATAVEEPIDLLINNAGIFGGREGGQRFGSLDYESWLAVIDTNVLGPMRVVEALVERVAESELRQIVTISSGMGSIEENGGGYYAYRSSKAAVNCAMRGLSRDLAGRGVSVCLIHPGWVRTDMGGEQAALSPVESVRGMRRVIAGLGRRDSGRFLDYRGTELPW